MVRLSFPEFMSLEFPEVAILKASTAMLDRPAIAGIVKLITTDKHY